MSVPDNERRDAAVGTPDSMLIASCRNGDRRAFAILWARHSGIARKFAWSLTQSFDADDLVSEAFVRILMALQEGKGPSEAFRPYLLSTVRNVAVSWARKNREHPSDVAGEVIDPRAADAAFFARVDAALLLRAFKTLPQRWQDVLWLTEVDALAPQEIASRLNLSANSVAALAYRAREGLRQAWVQVHVETDGVMPPHLWVLQHVGQHSRGALSLRNAARFDAHVLDCTSCRTVVKRAVDTSRRFTPSLLPLAVGIIAAAGIAGLLGHIGASAAHAAQVAPILSTLPTARERRSPLIVTLCAAAAVLIATAAGSTMVFSRPPSGAPPASASPIAAPTHTSGSSITSPGGGGGTPPAPPPPPEEQKRVRDEDGGGKRRSTSAPVVPLARAGAATVSSSAVRLVLNDVDTGGGVLLPVASGTARPGATVTVSLGAHTVAVTASSDGSWRTPEIAVAAGTYHLSAAADGTIARREVSITGPVVSVERRADGLTVAIRGMSGTRYGVSFSGAQHIVTTGGDGITTTFFSAGSVPGGTVTACAQEGDRSGPVSTIAVP